MSSFRLSDEGGRPTIKEVTELERECEFETLVESEGLDQQGAYLGRPQLGDLVKVHYIGRFIIENNTKDSTNNHATRSTYTDTTSMDDDKDENQEEEEKEKVEYTSTYQTDRPLTFTITDSADEDNAHDKSNMVLQGMKEGVKLMNLGELARLLIPPELGYGDQPCTQPQFARTIPPNSTLVLEVELLQIYRNGWWYRRNIPKKLKRNIHTNNNTANNNQSEPQRPKKIKRNIHTANHQAEPQRTDQRLITNFNCCLVS
eukprot:scaffold30375_cov55-Attheya_sp.AAC.1